MDRPVTTSCQSALVRSVPVDRWTPPGIAVPPIRGAGGGGAAGIIQSG